MNADSARIDGNGMEAVGAVEIRRVRVAWRSRAMLLLLRLLIRPMLARMLAKGGASLARAQLQTAAMRCPDTAGLSLAYGIVGDRVPGHVLGRLDGRGRALLWLHGGAFVMPAAPGLHHVLVARLCRDLGAAGFIPDYRLAPVNRFPAGLDDCERAYRALLDLGYRPKEIVLGGDSAGGNLVFGVLQRLHAAGLPLPACVIALSPVSEMGRGHAPPSRARNHGADPLLKSSWLNRIDDLYAGGHDSSDPLLSPLYMDCRGLPPILFQASESEILLDDTLMLAERARRAGVEVRCQVWDPFPHAVALFEPYFVELRAARADIVAFAQAHLAAGSAT